MKVPMITRFSACEKPFLFTRKFILAEKNSNTSTSDLITIHTRVLTELSEIMNDEDLKRKFNIPGDLLGLDFTKGIKHHGCAKVQLTWEGDSFRITQEADVPAPGFAEQLVGMNVGDKKEFTLTFPEDHPNEELAGKECLYHVSVSAIKIEVLPEEKMERKTD